VFIKVRLLWREPQKSACQHLTAVRSVRCLPEQNKVPGCRSLEWVGSQFGLRTTGVCVQSYRLGATDFTSSLQGDRLDPWDSEPPGGMFRPGPAQVPRPNPSLSSFLKLWMNLKPTRLQSPIHGSPFGV